MGVFQCANETWQIRCAGANVVKRRACRIRSFRRTTLVPLCTSAIKGGVEMAAFGAPISKTPLLWNRRAPSVTAREKRRVITSSCLLAEVRVSQPRESYRWHASEHVLPNSTATLHAYPRLLAPSVKLPPRALQRVPYPVALIGCSPASLCRRALHDPVVNARHAAATFELLFVCGSWQGWTFVA